MLVHRLRRWPNIKPTKARRLALPVNTLCLISTWWLWISDPLNENRWEAQTLENYRFTRPHKLIKLGSRFFISCRLVAVYRLKLGNACRATTKGSTTNRRFQQDIQKSAPLVVWMQLVVSHSAWFIFIMSQNYVFSRHFLETAWLKFTYVSYSITFIQRLVVL